MTQLKVKHRNCRTEDPLAARASFTLFQCFVSYLKPCNAIRMCVKQQFPVSYFKSNLCSLYICLFEQYTIVIVSM